MSKVTWKPGNMIYPVPSVLVSCGDYDGKYNLVTVAWTGTICTNPPMTYISLRPSRYSYEIIKETKEFVINLTTENIIRAVDYCGVKSGRDVDKVKKTGLTIEKPSIVKAPLIKESPVNIECVVKEIKKLGSHDMFIAEVVSLNIDDEYLDESQGFHLEKSKLLCYSHGKYFGLSEELGTFGYSVKKKAK